jgi:hypothetical protein
MNHWLFRVSLIIVFLFLLVLVYPNNTLTTEEQYLEKDCSDLGCTELCVVESPSCNREGTICCATNWTQGVCAFPSECPAIQAFSEYETLAVYQDTIRHNPSDLKFDHERFFVTLFLILLILYIMHRRRAHPLAGHKVLKRRL